MIKKLYDFRQTEIPAALLQAEVTREELDAELHRAAARFTEIVAVDGPVENGDVVKLSFADPKNPGELRQVYANVGKDFDDMEVRLPGLCVGGQVKIPHAGKEVEAQILAVKRLQVPALTDAHVAQLGIAQVADLAQFEEHLFGKLAEGQRKRKFRGIMGIVSKAMMENTEFEDLEGHPWYQALHNHMMGRVEAFAAQAGLSAEAALPAALRMDGKSLEECRQALKAMCIERARQGAMGQHYAQENGVTFPEMDTADLVGEYVDYLNQVVYQHFAPMVQVSRP
jgi:FKBP-type peptidyl-prolyl cis-trans isomerase (trigger factor)